MYSACGTTSWGATNRGAVLLKGYGLKDGLPITDKSAKKHSLENAFCVELFELGFYKLGSGWHSTYRNNSILCTSSYIITFVRMNESQFKQNKVLRL